MLNEFDAYAAEAVKEGWVISGPNGPSTAYELFHHLANDGSISDHPKFSRADCLGILSASWNSTRELSDLIEEGNKTFGEDLEDDE